MVIICLDNGYSRWEPEDDTDGWLMNYPSARPRPADAISEPIFTAKELRRFQTELRVVGKRQRQKSWLHVSRDRLKYPISCAWLFPRKRLLVNCLCLNSSLVGACRSSGSGLVRYNSNRRRGSSRSHPPHLVHEAHEAFKSNIQYTIRLSSVVS
ncbi:hypothetical protein EX30DRAFT_130698 [Ascodesmis nigricans]|uniref:Uncharacterized protein n=1 Tax=Ascodesmis nigricans TaxID=341454 RepID=A0A4S2MSE7_9PEZI|nr:hypothetical protein EX30DRAFT_130698 [Ascodesmis nigricans]